MERCCNVDVVTMVVTILVCCNGCWWPSAAAVVVVPRVFRDEGWSILLQVPHTWKITSSVAICFYMMKPPARVPSSRNIYRTDNTEDRRVHPHTLASTTLGVPLTAPPSALM